MAKFSCKEESYGSTVAGLLDTLVQYRVFRQQKELCYVVTNYISDPLPLVFQFGYVYMLRKWLPLKSVNGATELGKEKS